MLPGPIPLCPTKDYVHQYRSPPMKNAEFAAPITRLASPSFSLDSSPKWKVASSEPAEPLPHGQPPPFSRSAQTAA
jgi:hypothetical protein